MGIISTLNKAKSLGFDIGTRVMFTSFEGQRLTPLSGEDAEVKDEEIDYIHDYQRLELVHVLHSFTKVQVNEQVWPIVDDIYEQGLLVRYIPASIKLDKALNQAIDQIENKQAIPVSTIKQLQDSKTIFVPFRILDDSIDERLYYLFYEALIKQGQLEEVLPSKVTRHYFEVIETQFITKNMLRLYVKSDVTIPTDDPGFAYRFILKVLSKKDHCDSSSKANFDIRSLPRQIWKQLEPTIKQRPFATKLIDTVKKQSSILIFEVLKRLPEEQRDKLESKATQSLEGRYYTLRQLKQNHLEPNSNPQLGEVDIYIHEGSPGSEWAKSLKAGDIIYADNDYEETIKNMTIGQPLFICDETSMPSVATVLEQWQCNSVPIVISITSDAADFSYFDEVELSDQLKNKLNIHHINASEVNNIAESVIELIKDQHEKIYCAWGAIGKSDFRAIKQYLRKYHKLTGKLNRIRAYWV